MQVGIQVRNVPAELVPDDAPEAESVVARVDLIDELGLPRCARLRPPAVEWHVEG